MAGTAYGALERDLEAGRIVLIDGATGTELERRGAEMHERAWCAEATLSAPGLLEAIHRDYIRAGARLITTNTFSSNRLMLEPAGLGDRFEELNRQAVAQAQAAREAEGAAETVVIAASMSHQVPFVKDETGAVVGRNIPTPETAAAAFAEMASLMAGAGVDLILLEMMSNPELANAAIEAVRATGLPYWVGFSVATGEDDAVVSYTLPGLPAGEMMDRIDVAGAGAVGVMHSNVNVTGPALALCRERFDAPLMVYPDSGYFEMPHWHFHDIITPEALAAETRTWIAQGAQIVGGCCGLGLSHIQALARELRDELAPG